MKIETINLPLVVCGDIIEGKGISIFYKTRDPILLTFPTLNKSIIKKLSLAPDLCEIHIDDLIDFLTNVGDLWKNPNYDLRKESIYLQSKITGYTVPHIEFDYKTICATLTHKVLSEMIESEIGDKNLLEEWKINKYVEIRAFPRGKVLHILAGNVPAVGIVSLIRGILSKNSNILKLPSGNPVSTLYFVLSFRDVDKFHPVTRSVSALYWRHGDKVEDFLYKLSNAVCVWGRYDAVFSVRRKTLPGQAILEYGPKYSMHIIDKKTLSDEEALRKVALNAAHDIVLHEQNACFSPWIIFVEGDGEKFCEMLGEALDEEDKRFPKALPSLDKIAEIAEVRNICTLLGDKVYRSSGAKWTVILTRNPNRMILNPLSRTVFVVPINKLEDAIDYVDSKVMAVGLSSNEGIERLKNKLSAKGVERISYIGKLSYPPIGFTSSWEYPITRLVRLVTRDLSISDLKRVKSLKNVEKLMYGVKSHHIRFM